MQLATRVEETWRWCGEPPLTRLTLGRSRLIYSVQDEKRRPIHIVRQNHEIVEVKDGHLQAAYVQSVGQRSLPTYSDPGVQPSALCSTPHPGAGARYLQPAACFPRLFHHVVRSLPNNRHCWFQLQSTTDEHAHWFTLIIMPRDARSLLAAFVSEIFLWQSNHGGCLHTEHPKRGSGHPMWGCL
jgi:hypothetical protein